MVYPKNKNEQLNIPNSSIAKTKSELNDFMSWAIKAGIMTKEEAKQFKQWITKEVLPSIRKTGIYSTSLPIQNNQLSIMNEEDLHYNKIY